MSSTRDPTARLRAGLNPLLTASLGVYHGQTSNSTPLSGISSNSHNPFSSVHTPVSAMQPYNPQQWIASPAVSTAPDRAQQFQEPQGKSIPSVGWVGAMPLLLTLPKPRLPRLRPTHRPGASAR